MRWLCALIVVAGLVETSIAGAQVKSDCESGSAVAVPMGAGLGMGFTSTTIGAWLGVGFRDERWLLAGLLDVESATNSSFFGGQSHSWTLLGAGPLVVYHPWGGSGFQLHGFLGLGEGFGAIGHGLVATGGLGLGWGPLAVTLRGDGPSCATAPTATQSTCSRGDGTLTIQLSATIDLIPLGRLAASTPQGVSPAPQ
jgi:hypothetical protein